MYTREQVKKALDLYHECGSVTMTIRRLGYPSRTMLYQWEEDERKADNPREVRVLKPLSFDELPTKLPVRKQTVIMTM